MANRYEFSNYVALNFPNDCLSYMFEGRLKDMTREKYFYQLSRFFLELRCIDLLFYFDNEECAERKARNGVTISSDGRLVQKRECSRQRAMDCTTILSTIIAKTYSFHKPFERFTVNYFIDGSLECGIFTQFPMSQASIYRRLQDLRWLNYLTTFEFEKENMAFYGIRLDIIVRIIRPKLNKILEKYSLPTLPDIGDNDSACSGVADKNVTYQRDDGVPSQIINIANQYLTCFVKCYDYYAELVTYVNEFSGHSKFTYEENTNNGLYVRQKNNDPFKQPFKNIEEAKEHHAKAYEIAFRKQHSSSAQNSDIDDGSVNYGQAAHDYRVFQGY